jgi:hypothetical protein
MLFDRPSCYLHNEEISPDVKIIILLTSGEIMFIILQLFVNIPIKTTTMFFCFSLHLQAVTPLQVSTW